MCGWCKDKWGLSGQITPRALLAAITDPDRAAARRAFEAMMGMKKIDIAAVEAARRG
jgi:2-polyprenyl-6-hydroxyphenyl methylase/3-demethylubiquinone-9 3-methyltransferase